MVRALACLATYFAASPALACRLALLLALDVSSSVDADEDRLQRFGLVSALMAPEVQAAFFANDSPVALAVFEWSGRYNHSVVLDWTLIDDSAALARAAGVVAASTRSEDAYPTAMGFALGYGSRMLARAPQCQYRTIDMAGDGQNNEGFGPRLAYREFPFDDVTVNGLVVNATDFDTKTDLVAYYRREVLHGPGAFLEVAQGFEDFERAMRRKLERELRPPVIGVRRIGQVSG